MKQERLEVLKNLLLRYEIDLENGLVVGRKPFENNNGYLRISCSYKGKHYNFYVHEFIAVAGGLDVLGMNVNHIDGNKKNNSFANLEVVTSRENTLHAVKNDLCGGAKLTAEQVTELRNLYAKEKMTQTEIGKKFGIGQTNVSEIVRRKTWTEVV
jgi:predicted XRE-type DNA-binding protein